MHLNSCFMIGRVRAKGPQLRYAENGTPLYSFLLEIDELTNGRTYTTYIPCEITGKYAEQTAVGVKPGDVLQLAGKWKYKSTVDPKSGVKVSKPVVSSWGISQRQAAVPELPQEEISAVDGGGYVRRRDRATWRHWRSRAHEKGAGALPKVITATLAAEPELTPERKRGQSSNGAETSAKLSSLVDSSRLLHTLSGIRKMNTMTCINVVCCSQSCLGGDFGAGSAKR
jgi:hypothetical protein